MEEKSLQFKWVIKRTDNDKVVGWINTGNGYEGNVKKGFKFGYSASYCNDVYTYGSQSVEIILTTTALSVFDHIDFVVNVGTLSIFDSGNEYNPNPYSAEKKYQVWDSETQQYVISPEGEGSQNCVAINYVLDLNGIEPKSIDSIEFTLNLPNLDL